MKRTGLDIAFVILHYVTYEDTVNCVKSIKKYIDTENYKIVIVDNCSPNNSYEELSRTFKEDESVYLIHSDQNLGFAKGNNIGIDYVRDNWNADFIAVINNDTELMRGAFFEIIKEKYNESGFSVFGPMVISGDGNSSTSPICNEPPTRKRVERETRHFKRVYLINKYHLYKVYLFLLSVRDFVKKPQIKKPEIFKDRLNVGLNGCFLVFSKKYFEKFKGFDRSTFMYFEEYILLLHLKYNKLVSLYSPDIRIYHKELSATNSSSVSNRQKVEFRSLNRYNSRLEYLRILNKYEGK